MKKYATAAMLLLFVGSGIVGADDTWVPRMDSPSTDYSIFHQLAEFWQGLVNFF